MISKTAWYEDVLQSPYIEFIEGQFQQQSGRYIISMKIDFVWFDCGGPKNIRLFREYWFLCSGYIFFHYTYYKGVPMKI